MKDYATIIGSFITSLVTCFGFYLSSKFTKRNIKQSLDGASEWRKNLFIACSKKDISIDEIQLLRTSLRFSIFPGKVKEYSFNWFSNKSIEFCDSLIDSYYENGSSELSPNDQKIARLIIRCLLKNHWEYSEQLSPDKKYYNSEIGVVVKTTTIEIRNYTNDYFKADDESLDQESIIEDCKIQKSTQEYKSLLKTLLIYLLLFASVVFLSFVINGKYSVDLKNYDVSYLIFYGLFTILLLFILDRGLIKLTSKYNLELGIWYDRINFVIDSLLLGLITYAITWKSVVSQIPFPIDTTFSQFLSPYFQIFSFLLIPIKIYFSCRNFKLKHSQ